MPQGYERTRHCRAPTEVIKRLAVENGGMTTLYWDAMERVRAGLCSIEDTLAEVRKDEFDSRPAWMFEELGLERGSLPR